MSDVRIYRPSKNAMQSGRRGNCVRWVLEYTSSEANVADPLMGWIGSGDTAKQIELKFDSKEAAIAYATEKELSYEVQEPQERKIHIKNYADNFSSVRRF